MHVYAYVLYADIVPPFLLCTASLGRESGEVLRLLHSHGINWGTYTDLLATHCNAHSNNFVLIPPGDDDGALCESNRIESSRGRTELLCPLAEVDVTHALIIMI